MAITAHVYQIYIAAAPEKVWAAITDSEWTRQYFFGTTFATPLTAGQRYLTRSGGEDAVDGTVEVLEPPSGGRPGRLVQTWHVLYDAALAAEPPSRVEWTVEAAGNGLTRVRLVHDDLAASPGTWANVRDGWVWVLDGMKTLLETGRPLPPVTQLGAGPEGVATEAGWHRRQAVEANNRAFELLAGDRDAAGDEELLRTAYAAAYHWQRAAGAGPDHQVRAGYLISRALQATGQPEAALSAAERTLLACREAGLDDFDLAYAHEARARALRALGRDDEARQAWAAALAVPIADAEDAALLRSDLSVDPVG